MSEFLKIFSPMVKKGHFAIVDVLEDVKDGEILVKSLFEGTDNLADKWIGLGVAAKNLSEGKETGIAINPEDDVKIPD
jgi:glycerol uptake facilitator-like aquaporin